MVQRSDTSEKPASPFTPVTLERLPLHAKVRETIRTLIMTEFKDGDKFLSEVALIARLGVSLGTVRHAMVDLAREGLLERCVPQGTFVRKPDHEAWEVRVIMPQAESIFLNRLMSKLVSNGEDMQLDLRIHQTHRGETPAEIIRLLHGSPSRHRIILLGEVLKPSRSLYMALAKRGHRVVNVDNLLPGCGDVYVGVDNDIGMKLGMRHLMELGHRRITLLENEPSSHGNTRARVQSFRQVAAATGLSHARVVACDDEPHEQVIRRAVDRVLDAKVRPTALFAVSDLGAWVALKVLAERGIKVPGEVSVLGFDDDSASQYMHPALSTLAQPYDAISRRALELAAADETPSGMVMVPPSLVIRESTGPVTP